MDNKRIPIHKQVKDCLIHLDDSFAVRLNLIVSERSSWPLLLGRNFQDAIGVGIVGSTMYY